MDIASISTGLRQDHEGIWRAINQSEISYPEEGNLNCLALEADSFWFVHRNQCIEAVMRRFPPPGTVLDVGGGNGYVALGLQQAGIPVALLEPGPQGVVNAHGRGVQQLICSTLEDACFLPGALPAVGLFDVVEHIEDDQKFMEQIFTDLCPGGRVYLTVPAYQQLWSVDDDYAGHFRRYTTTSLRRMLTAAGFEVEFTGYIFWMLPPAIFLGRVLPGWFGLRKQDDWDRYEQEHHEQVGIVGKTLNWLLGWELNRVRAGKGSPWGGSCLVVARRPVIDRSSADQ